MATRRLAYCLSLSVLGGCLSASTQSATPIAGSPTVASARNSDALAMVNGVRITQTMIPSAVNEQLHDIRNEMLQRQLHMQWAGVEEAIDGVLLTREAERRGMTAAALRSEGIDSNVVVPTDEEIRKQYDANEAAIGVPFEVAAPYLKEQLHEQRRIGAEQDFLDTLRRDAEITYTLPIPELPRSSVEAGNAPAQGPSDAKVTLVEFSDFECPYCSRARNTLDELRRLYPDDLRVVFRDFPLKQHQRARPAAEAAQCAHQQDRFWEYHDLLFDNQEALSEGDLKGHGNTLGLDMKAFETCRGSSQTKDVVAANLDAGRRYGVEGTPALFLNGVKLIGLMPVPLLKMLIDSELSR